jgi:asparagine N-glycosylation enzyme membrane subunit Stt3
LGFPTGRSTTRHQAIFVAPLPGRKRISASGVSRFQSFTLLLFCFILLLLAYFYRKYKKNSSFIVVIFACLLLVLLEWVLLRKPSCVILLAPTTMILSALLLRHLILRQKFYEIKSALLNLVMKVHFSGVSIDDAAAHLNNFVELCEMQKYKDVDGDII